MNSNSIRLLVNLRTAARRDAVTLIEVIATLSVLLVLAVASVRMLSSVTQIGARAADNNRGRLSIERLATSVRRDVQAAINVTADSWPMHIDTSDREIQYDFDSDANAILRSVLENSKRVASDRFELPEICEPELLSESDVVRISLMRGPTVSWSIEVPKP